jgi:phage-related protein
MKKVIWMGSSREDLRGFPRDACREIGFQLESVQEGDAAGGNLCVALFPKEVAEDKSTRFGLGAEAI